MYALGRVSDIEKIVWFAAGTAITAVATVVQSYLSNKRAADERNFAERIENIRQKHSEHTRNNELAFNARHKAYEYFAECLGNVFHELTNKDEIDKLQHASQRVLLVAPPEISLLVSQSWSKAMKVHDCLIGKAQWDGPQSPGTHFGEYVFEVLNVMREDIGKSSICLNNSTGNTTSTDD